jgi:predicted ATPase
VRGELARLLPELDESSQTPATVGWDDSWGRQRLLDALWRTFEAVASRRRLALVVEDVHWADPTTLELVGFLLSPGRARSVPIVLTCRSEHEPTAELAAWLEHLHRLAVRRLDLAALTQAETAEQITLLSGERAPHDLVQPIFARSEGNEFFTEQLVAFARRDRDRASRLGVSSPGLTGLLLARTAPVTGTAREVMASLAVAARPLEGAELARLCGRPVREVQAALPDLASRRLLPGSEESSGVQLRHALLAEAVVGDLLVDERRDLHVRIAQLMAALHGPAVAADIAEHFAAANRPREELRWRAIAAREAKYASREAAVHRRRALALSLIPRIRSALYGTARTLGDVQAVRTGRIGRRVYNRLVRRALSRLFRR